MGAGVGGEWVEGGSWGRQTSDLLYEPPRDPQFSAAPVLAPDVIHAQSKDLPRIFRVSSGMGWPRPLSASGLGPLQLPFSIAVAAPFILHPLPPFLSVWLHFALQCRIFHT